MKGGRKSAKALRKRPIDDPKSNPRIRVLVEGYFEDIGREDVLEKYEISAAGQDQGEALQERTRERFVVLLKPRRRCEEERPTLDWILVAFKETHSDDYAALDMPWFCDPNPTQGPRMAEASRIYSAPGQLPIGSVLVGGREFYGRPMPVLNEKVERILTRQEMQDLAFFVAAQLGSGHARTLERAEPSGLAAHLKEHLRKTVVPAVERIVEDGRAAHREYLRKLRKAGRVHVAMADRLCQVGAPDERHRVGRGRFGGVACACPSTPTARTASRRWRTAGGTGRASSPNVAAAAPAEPRQRSTGAVPVSSKEDEEERRAEEQRDGASGPTSRSPFAREGFV